MSRADGGGWYGESRRHAEAAKKGRPARSVNAGAPPSLSRERDRREFYRWNRGEESRDVKKMIREKYGIDASVTQGTGTAFSWIYVRLKGDVSRETEHEVYQSVLRLTGRDRYYDTDPDRNKADISVETPDRAYNPETWRPARVY